VFLVFLLLSTVFCASQKAQRLKDIDEQLRMSFLQTLKDTIWWATTQQKHQNTHVAPPRANTITTQNINNTTQTPTTPADSPFWRHDDGRCASESWCWCWWCFCSPIDKPLGIDVSSWLVVLFVFVQVYDDVVVLRVGWWLVVVFWHRCCAVVLFGCDCVVLVCLCDVGGWVAKKHCCLLKRRGVSLFLACLRIA
jgi:hypothetical protein